MAVVHASAQVAERQTTLSATDIITDFFFTVPLLAEKDCFVNVTENSF
jgi:hypothetical protein